MLKVKRSFCALALGLAVCFPGSIYASDTHAIEKSIDQQKRKVTGTITDDYGTVIGASIAVKGTSTGTISDLNGNFSIEVSDGQVLVFSFTGYVTQEVTINGQNNLSIHLLEDAQVLDEVVVTALGMSRERKSLGYAVTELGGEEFAKINVVNPIGGLQGKVAGVQINMGNSGPQSSNRIIIRGNTSLGNNNQPIFVIDGVIIDNTVTNSAEWEAQLDFGNDIKNLNSDDFESVSVLKGAAATALYGSRAANGVILITTKKGKAGEGLGVSVSHSMMWDNVYKFPDIQNQYGPGTTTVWGLNADGSQNRNVGTTTQNFGPAYDGLPYTQGGEEWIYAAQKDNIKQMYQTGKYMNTNVAVQGGDDKGTFRLSYSHLKSNGTTFNNDYSRNSFSLNATRNISKFLTAEAGVAWVHSDTKNPTFQGGGRSPIYDFMYNVPRTYDTGYWLNNYKSAKGDGYNSQDPISYTATIWDYFENDRTQKEDNIRGNAKLDFKITDWLNVKLLGDFNKLYSNRENKILATGSSEYRGSSYNIDKTDKDQYKLTAIVNAHSTFGDFGVNGAVAVEQWNTSTSYYRANSQGGLRTPGQFDMTNSIQQATISTRINTNRKRINSAYAYVNLDWKSQVYLDITGRNDWSSALIYSDGSGTVSYFYPSVSASWLVTESFREQLPSFISFAKLRASYAIVGNDCDPYLTSIGYYKVDENNSTYPNPHTGSEYPNYVFDSNALRNLDLKPEKQHSVEVGAEIKFLNNRLGFDFAWYKTNTKNQILALSQANETGMQTRWINAGNIQNSGIELAITAIPIQTRDWNWDVNLNLTRNRNKIVSLVDGLSKYTLEGSMDMTAYATVGGAYGDIYSTYAYARNDKGEKILNQNGTFKRSGTSELIGSIQPDLMAGFSTALTYKNITVGAVLDARFGGDIASGSYNYGMASGTLKSSLKGRTKETGGLERTLSDGRVVYDGIIPDGVFDKGVVINNQDVSGMSYAEAYKQGLVQPLSAYSYYDGLHSWGTGIREATIHECSWIALREISIRYTLPKAWISKAGIQGLSLGLIARNLGYLYNSLPDNIHPEGLPSNRSAEFVERGGSAYTRSFGFNVNVTF